jgi:hypothetical protein
MRHIFEMAAMVPVWPEQGSGDTERATSFAKDLSGHHESLTIDKICARQVLATIDGLGSGILFFLCFLRVGGARFGLSKRSP